MPASPVGSADAYRRVVRDWLESLHEHIDRHGIDGATDLLAQLERAATTRGWSRPTRPPVTQPVNTIPHDREPPYPGDADVERRVEAFVRWNAMAMVVRGNRESPGLGGHISTYASAATLFETGFHHFFRGRDGDGPHDRLFLQGHASPGVYARAFVEGRLGADVLDGFRRELSRGGPPSYPHPRTWPEFWEYPTVSMGLAPLMGIHQARFDRYLVRRGLAATTARTWVLCGDGEMDEPESCAGINLAVRERLANLVFVVNCNLQRLDGPVRPNARVVDELEARFAAAGWRVVKVMWGGAWDPLFAADRDGELVARLAETIDGDWQRWAVEDGATFRDELFGTSRSLLELVDGLDDDAMARLARARGGHDRRKVHAAYATAVAERERPTVVLAQTIKGYGLGEWGEARNATHKRQTLDDAALHAFRVRFDVPIADDDVADAAYVAPAEGSPEARYVAARRRALGGAMPRRIAPSSRRDVPSKPFARALRGSGDRELSTTAALVRLLTALLDNEAIGELLVPIVPDEARTFGMEPLFRSAGIHAPRPPRYEPVDAGTLTEYRETPAGQLIEQGISEAGALATAIAAGTAHVAHGLPTVPFYFFYSMFGFQRVGDLIWAAGDSLARGFLIGATSGRTTLNGEGLQHQDGHSHLLAMAHPGLRAYDTAFAYEVAVLVEHGLRRPPEPALEDLTTLTVASATHRHPPLPDGAREGIVRGLYALRRAAHDGRPRVRVLASGPLVHEAMHACDELDGDYGVSADLFVVTSWGSLYTDALAAERRRRLGRGERAPWLVRVLGEGDAPIVAVSDFVQHLPHVLARWTPGELHALGTHGFGRSDTREALRDHFEVDRRHVVHAALHALAVRDEAEPEAVAAAAAELGDVQDPPPYPLPDDQETS